MNPLFSWQRNRSVEDNCLINYLFLLSFLHSITRTLTIKLRLFVSLPLVLTTMDISHPQAWAIPPSQTDRTPAIGSQPTTTLPVTSLIALSFRLALYQVAQAVISPWFLSFITGVTSFRISTSFSLLFWDSHSALSGFLFLLLWLTYIRTLAFVCSGLAEVKSSLLSTTSCWNQWRHRRTINKHLFSCFSMSFSDADAFVQTTLFGQASVAGML